MSLAVSDAQRMLTEAIADWAQRSRPLSEVRAAADGSPVLPVTSAAWASLAEIGLPGICVAESYGGAGGLVADVVAGVAAAAEVLAPGPLASTAAVAALLTRRPGGGRALEAIASGVHAAIALDGGLAPGADAAAWLLVPAETDRWLLLPPGHDAAVLESVAPLDPSRSLARITLRGDADECELVGVTDLDVRAWAGTFAAAESAGVAAALVRMAAEYARVREQFGRPIGAFQAIKGICAEMLCRSESAAALAWDAGRAADEGSACEHRFAAAAAAALALDAAVDNAKDAIQVLGGIGFTWEHDAHLYLRRSVATRQLLGGSAAWRAELTRSARAGVRRNATVSARIDPDEANEIDRAAAEFAAQPVAERRRALAASGYLVPHWPPPYGRAADAAQQLAIDAALAKHGVERPDLVIGAWAAPTILAHGTAAQAERFVWPTLRGEITWCQLFSEPEAGSDLASLRTAATRVDGGWRLQGQKVWTSLAHEADWAICLARTDSEAPKHRGITYFLVDMRSPGMRIRPLREITGDERFNEVFLDGVEVPDDCVVGDVNGGWRLARTTLSNERVAMSGGSSLGGPLEALLITDADTDTVGRLVAEAAACAALDARSALARLDGHGPGASSSVRKLVGVRHRQAVAEASLIACGPDGAGADPATRPAQYEFLLTRCLSIAGGTSQILKNVAAEQLLGLPRS
ncbi:acyl-CoA dehydrogenase [Tsukamurella sp. 8F]|uniref:acyl-CoA dehydrogenase n=1 Tax=unclassified Tsukamurella TaxID=2633480 RepID=UPI0023B94B7E|nr:MULTISPECIES: acyl-CoA dehydrogenase [unclassified Tsukamurella]MDF0530740.1 acyl-CoA dehydrogenase [Tsukamurella sp. 8J]MDF0587941.1 acyl-CoA dehydrogenase [Tsukamurella sp. 8F]